MGHAIASLLLRGIESLIRLNYKLRAVLWNGTQRGDSKAGGDRMLAPSCLLESQPETLGRHDRSLAVRIRQDDRELFSPIARKKVRVAGIFLEDPRHDFEHLIPGWMSILVVEIFEVVYIQHNQG